MKTFVKTLVILKRAFPHFIEKTIVRNAVKCSVLTIIDSDVLDDGSSIDSIMMETAMSWSSCRSPELIVV